MNCRKRGEKVKNIMKVKRVTDAKISDVIKRLEELKKQHGDIGICAVSYRSELVDDPITTEDIEKQIFISDGGYDEKFRILQGHPSSTYFQQYILICGIDRRNIYAKH